MTILQVARVEGHSESAWSLHVFAKQYAVPSVAGEVELAKLYWQKGKQRDALACFASIVKEHGDERESAAKYAGDEAEKVAMRDTLTKVSERHGVTVSILYRHSDCAHATRRWRARRTRMILCACTAH